MDLSPEASGGLTFQKGRTVPSKMVEDNFFELSPLEACYLDLEEGSLGISSLTGGFSQKLFQKNRKAPSKIGRKQFF